MEEHFLLEQHHQDVRDLLVRHTFGLRHFPLAPPLEVASTHQSACISPASPLWRGRCPVFRACDALGQLRSPKPLFKHQYNAKHLGLPQTCAWTSGRAISVAANGA